jgi:hypothetical protein
LQRLCCCSSIDTVWVIVRNLWTNSPAIQYRKTIMIFTINQDEDP